MIISHNPDDQKQWTIITQNDEEVVFVKSLLESLALRFCKNNQPNFQSLSKDNGPTNSKLAQIVATTENLRHEAELLRIKQRNSNVKSFPTKEIVNLINETQDICMSISSSNKELIKLDERTNTLRQRLIGLVLRNAIEDQVSEKE